MALPVYVFTSDNHLHALRGFSLLFNRYWSELQPITVVGFSAPSFDLPSNFSFMSLGDFSDYPKDRWSDALIKFMSTISDELFVLLLEDYWLSRTVDHQGIESLGDYMRINQQCVRMDLTTDRLYAGGMSDYDAWGRLDLIKSSPYHPYHMSLQAAIWRKSLLQEIIIPGESPWEVELIGNSRLVAREDMVVLGTRQCPVRYGITLKNGLSGYDPEGLQKLQSRDLYELQQKGYLEI